MPRDFLNAGILGANIGAAAGRGFRPVNTDNLPVPDYDGRYFETFPTVWASAYAFRKELEKGDPIAAEEWITLFLLHYFGVLHVLALSQVKLETEYDRDVWLALHGTYPATGEDDLNAIYLLQTEDGTVVGASHPQTVFFPSRGRENWRQDRSLGVYLSGTRLSLQKASHFLEDEHDRDRFHQHLRSLVGIIPLSALKDRLDGIADQQFGTFRGDRPQYSRNPIEIPHATPDNISPAEYLANYPLKKEKVGGGTIYYLFSDMDLSGQPEWVTRRAKGSRYPVASNYLQTSTHPNNIFVKSGGRLIDCPLGDLDEAVRLKDLFLGHEPFWCKVGKTGEDFAALFSPKHELTLPDAAIRPGEKSLCLAPITEKFLWHFPDVLDGTDFRTESDAHGNVTWRFVLEQREVCWVTRCQSAPGLPNTALSMYPPRVSPQWKFYAAYGRGSKKTGGRWHLVDQNGTLGQLVDIDDGNYYSILHTDLVRDLSRPIWPKSVEANQPRAILVKDAGDTERGVLFLARLPSVDVDHEQVSSMAMDFGTSNTCLALKPNDGEADTLRFSMSPLRLWGLPSPNEAPGFVPQKWSTERKDFFPTVLLSRKSDAELPTISPNELRLEHLFKVDIPSLHRDMSQSLLDDTINNDWRRHDNLKWGADERTPWRSLFLELTLLYAHAEVFFSRQSKINKYVFTYPLAFADEYKRVYEDKAQEAVKRVRRMSYADDSRFEFVSVDESTAIAKSLGQDGVKGSLETFIDIGGGTADVAVRHERSFLVLDSLKIAGRTFFSVGRKTLREPETAGSVQFREHLQKLLGVDPLHPSLEKLKLELGSLYSLRINELDDKIFRDREFAIIKERMGDKSFPRYRAQLFFQHLITYALLQACAAAVSQKIIASNGINMVLGGNGWGLLLFAEWERSRELLKSKAEHILRQLKKHLSAGLSQEEAAYLDKLSIKDLKLLNEKDLSDAKTRVARGALKASETVGTLKDTEPFSGITITDLEINSNQKRTVRWCDRWRKESFTQSTEDQIGEINSVRFGHPEELNSAIDEVMKIFTGLGNTDDLKTDNLPSSAWQQINGQLITGIKSMQTDGKRLAIADGYDEDIKDSAVPANFFLSRILYNAEPDFLEVLADTNGNFRVRR